VGHAKASASSKIPQILILHLHSASPSRAADPGSWISHPGSVHLVLQLVASAFCIEKARVFFPSVSVSDHQAWDPGGSSPDSCRKKISGSG
jgi:hypothetical protein